MLIGAVSTSAVVTKLARCLLKVVRAKKIYLRMYEDALITILAIREEFALLSRVCIWAVLICLAAVGPVLALCSLLTLTCYC